MNAKKLGYKVINEFGKNIASIVNLEFDDNNEVIKVIDEFGCNIIKCVHIEK